MVSTLLLNLTNPTAVLSFLAVLAALGLGYPRQWWSTLILIGGIFCGSMAWWMVLSAIVNHFRGRFNRRLVLCMNRVAGSAIGGFGVALMVLSRSRL
jgi:threonine/homoserine/homoserine lactone efflux protein